MLHKQQTRNRCVKLVRAYLVASSASYASFTEQLIRPQRKALSLLSTHTLT
jgi:hypothetical protein